MRAVNLVPEELRGAGGPSRSGGAVYAVLGALALLLVLVSATTLLGRQVAGREARATALEAEATQVETQAAGVARYKELAAEAAGRVQRVRDLAAARIDWSVPLADVAAYIGDEVRFTGLSATTSAAAGDGATANPLRAALPGPAVSLTGCARDHAAVARLIARLRAMDDVKRVSLAASTIAPEATPGATSASATTGGAPSCASFSSRPSDFQVVIFLEPGANGTTPGATALTATTGTTP